MIFEVWSGGQTGVDQAGLRAAVLCNITTGGWAPYEYMTEEGRAADLLKRFGLRECKVFGYRTRTSRNAQETHGTIWLGMLDTPGFEATSSCVVWPEKRPFLVNPSTHDFLVWIYANGISRLNVAGNRESKNKGIGARAEQWLVDAFKKALSNSEQTRLSASRHPFDFDGSRSSNENSLRRESSENRRVVHKACRDDDDAGGDRNSHRDDVRHGVIYHDVVKRWWPWHRLT